MNQTLKSAVGHSKESKTGVGWEDLLDLIRSLDVVF